MGLLRLAWHAVLYLLLLTITSFAGLQGNRVLVNKSSSVLVDVYHARGPHSSLALESPSSSLSDLLSLDEERVKALTDRVIAKQRKGRRTPGGDDHHDALGVGPNSDRIPLYPGLAIGTGNYYVKLGLGSPPKYYSMLLDTGSSLPWLQCQPCMLYCHSQTDPLFDPSVSNTYKSLSCSTSQCSWLKASTLNDPFCSSASKCVYTASYGDQSFSRGYLSQDLLTLAPSQTLPSFVFGCGQENLGLFGRSAGIVGLARDRLSMLAQLSPKYGYAFSYCLPTSTSQASSAGGFLSVGGIPPSSSYKFTTMLSDSKNPSLYFLRLASIVVGGSPLRLSGGGAQFQVPTIIDSGTVITRLSSPVYSALSQAFANIMLSKKYARAPAYSILDTCFSGSLKTLSSGTPEIRMIFQGGADLTLPASNVLIEADDGVTCLAFASSSRGSDQIAIIGNHQQQTFNIAYDVSGSKIGFAPGGCR